PLGDLGGRDASREWLGADPRAPGLFVAVRCRCRRRGARGAALISRPTRSFRPISALLLAAGAVALGAPGGGAGDASLALRSPAFSGEIRARYTCDGEDVSPPLTWSEPPAGTRSLALIVDDPDAPDPKAPQRTWVHWIVYDLPAQARELPEG